MEQSEAFSSLAIEFPEGIRVLAVDDHIVCLRVLEVQLKHCGYVVTATQRPETALELLRQDKNKYDLVIVNVNMPGMDGFKLLEIIGLEMDLPVIMLSANNDTNYVMKGILHGAVDYLVKPLRIEDLKLIWKHVIKKRSLCAKSTNVDRCDKTDKSTISVENGASVVDNHTTMIENENHEQEEENDETIENLNGPEQKRKRIMWTKELHAGFVDACNHLGSERTTPKKILDLMNVDGLTRQHIASHLQKYRNALRKNGTESKHPQVRYGANYIGFGPRKYHNTLIPSRQSQNLHSTLNPVSSKLFSFPSRHQHDMHQNFGPLVPQPTHLELEHAEYSPVPGVNQHSGLNNLTYNTQSHVTCQFDRSMNGFIQNSSWVDGSMNNLFQNSWTSGMDLEPTPAFQMQSSLVQDFSSSLLGHNNSESAVLTETIHGSIQASTDAETAPQSQGI